LRYYTSSRRDAVQLDFRAADLDGAPAWKETRKPTLKPQRALDEIEAVFEAAWRE
jgi:hypothetical protein